MNEQPDLEVVFDGRRGDWICIPPLGFEPREAPALRPAPVSAVAEADAIKAAHTWTVSGRRHRRTIQQMRDRLVRVAR